MFVAAKRLKISNNRKGKSVSGSVDQCRSQSAQPSWFTSGNEASEKIKAVDEGIWTRDFKVSFDADDIGSAVVAFGGAFSSARKQVIPFSMFRLLRKVFLVI